MLRIKNKTESIKLIKQLKLNQFEEEVFKKGEEDKVLEFINRYPYPFYAIRSKSIVGCN